MSPVERRLYAVDLVVRCGWSKAEAGRAAGLSREYARRLVEAWRQGGCAALLPRARGRRPIDLDSSEVLGLRSQGAAWAEIARRAGVSDFALRRWRSRAARGLPMLAVRRSGRLRSRLDAAEAERLRGQGLRWADVAERLGVTDATLRKRRREWDA